MGDAHLTVEGIGKSFAVKGGEPIDAVRDINFDVQGNEFCILLGPSGCGKSTILRMIAGLETPTAGQMILGGQTITGPDRDRGMVFQNYTSFDWLTVEQNVEYGMRINKVPEAERKELTREYIELVHLTKFREAYPRQLSGGMKQRVAIARTLANQPSLLLMDEPFGALDAETRWSMQELMLSIMASTGTTVVMVTHDIEEALFLGDRIIFISRHPGTVLEEIPVDYRKGQDIVRKEDAVTSPGYAELERHIISLMRSQAHVLA